MLQQEDGGQAISPIGVIHQYRSLTHDLLILFADEADHRFQERVSGADEGRNGLLVDLVLLETDAFVLLLDRSACPDLAVSFAYANRNVRDLPTPLLSPLDPAA